MEPHLRCYSGSGYPCLAFSPYKTSRAPDTAGKVSSPKLVAIRLADCSGKNDTVPLPYRRMASLCALSSATVLEG